MKEPTRILCVVRLRPDHNPQRIPGSTTIPCSKCGATCLIAPSGVEFMKRVTISAVCQECLPTTMVGIDPTDVAVKITPGALDELRQVIFRKEEK